MSDLMQAPHDSGLEPLDEAAGGNRNRMLAVVGIAAGVVVLGLAAFFLFFSGGGDEVYAPPPKGNPPAAEQQGGKNHGKDNAVPPVYQGEVGTDPFQPLAAEEVVQPPEPDPTASAAPSDGVALSPDYYQVSIASIDGGQTTLVVNGVAYTLTVGARFPDTTTGPFQLEQVAADGSSVTLKYGSETVTIKKNQGYSVKAG